MELNVIHNENCLTGLQKLPDNSIDCCVTSPPYYGLRDYGIEEQIGNEETPEQFINNLVAVFEEVRRALKPEGVIWVNMGDSYAAAGKNRTPEQAQGKSTLEGRKNGNILTQINKITGDLKAKDLIGIPWMLAFALRSAGWYLRQDIIWHKPNPMPESVTDRCTKAHEYIFLLSKSSTYYFDAEAISEPAKYWGERDRTNGKYHNVGSGQSPHTGLTGVKKDKRAGKGRIAYTGKRTEEGVDKNVQQGFVNSNETRNKRSVWSCPTKPFKGAHFATFPENLIVDCIKGGCPASGVVLDPFMGAGTTALVAQKLNRNYIGFELNPEYIKISEERLYKELGMFNPTK